MKEHDPENAVKATDIRERLDRDKAYASEVIGKARHELANFRSTQLVPDITGKPKDAVQFNQYKRAISIATSK